MNRVIVSGYLTSDPHLLRLDSGTSVCKLRIGCPSGRRDHESGRWRQKPNYFDVTVFGDQAEATARRTGKGASIAVDGRLDWREWESRDGRRTQGVSIIAEHVHFMDHAQGQARRAGEDRPVGGPAIGHPGEPVRARSPAEAGPPTTAGADWLSLSAQAPGDDRHEFDLLGAEGPEPTASDEESTETTG